MKTYLFPHVLTAVLPKKGHLKRLIACVFTSGISIITLANTAPFNIFSLDTNRVGADQNTVTLQINPSTQIAGVNGNEEFSLPLVMTAFKAVLNSNKVVLTWTTGLEKRLSHFIIERSTNGIDYKETAIIFAVTNSSAKQNYTYQDAVNIHENGMLYYRIKLVDPVGKFQNSAVKLIRVASEPVLEVATYPNPVINEIRITIPSSWQNQMVRYEVYNISGRLVKRFISNNANQTEIVNMKDCVAGMYMVRTSTLDQSKSQCIVKK